MKKVYFDLLKKLDQGSVCIFPTDTVMGIGCLMNFITSINRMYRIKKRDLLQPMAVLVSDMDMARSLMLHQPDEQLQELMTSSWPGDLTIVVDANDKVPQILMGKSSKVGVRIPDYEELQSVIKKLGVPLVATSVNLSGYPAATHVCDIDQNIKSLVDFIVEIDSEGSKSSKVIDYLGDGEYWTIRK